MYFSWQNIMLNLFKNIPAAFAALLFICSISYSEIEVRLSIDKTKLLVAEPIIISIEFFNRSSEKDSINYYSYDEFYSCLKLNNNEGSKFIRSQLHAEFGNDIPFEVIDPMESRSFQFDLLEYTGTLKLLTSGKLQRMCLSEGSYSLLYDGAEASNSITFRISEPAGDESAVLEKLISAYSLVTDSDKKSKEQARLFFQIASENEASVYNELSVYMYNCLSGHDTTDLGLNSAFVEKYPDSYFLKEVFSNLCTTIYLRSGEKGIEFYLKEIALKYTNNRVFALAKEMQKNKDYLK